MISTQLERLLRSEGVVADESDAESSEWSALRKYAASAVAATREEMRSGQKRRLRRESAATVVAASRPSANFVTAVIILHNDGELFIAYRLSSFVSDL